MNDTEIKEYYIKQKNPVYTYNFERIEVQKVQVLSYNNVDAMLWVENLDDKNEPTGYGFLCDPRHIFKEKSEAQKELLDQLELSVSFLELGIKKIKKEMEDKQAEGLRNNSENAQCANCMFSKIVHENGYIGDYRDPSDYTWECRYNPPQVTDTVSKYPIVCWNAFCGHFAPAMGKRSIEELCNDLKYVKGLYKGVVSDIRRGFN